MSLEDYRKALKTGKKIYRNCVMKGQSPYLPTLERLLNNVKVLSQEPLGIVDIPLEQISGTYYQGRQPTFSQGFFPLMPEESEFAQKWITLCETHLKEGIHEPIKAYEYLNRFYVVEGHKRVSILKYFGADSIRGSVTRTLPQLDDSTESKIYAEFLQFYALTGINSIWFSEEGGFSTLLKLLGKGPDEVWDDDTKAEFRSFLSTFRQAFREQMEKFGHKLGLTLGDVMLIYLKIFDYASSEAKTATVIQGELSKIWNEVQNKNDRTEINLILKPTEIKNWFVPRLTSRLRIAFLHNKNAETSSWVCSHEVGRKDLEEAFGGQVETYCIDNIETDAEADAAIASAIANHADLIFTTSPRLLEPSVKAALANPKAKILNCSLNTSHPSVRTYYARMYEAKFLMGMIAGSLSPVDSIGYVEEYPIYGITANINAFALGAKMVNPRAQVFLRWSKTVDQAGCNQLDRSEFAYLSDRDMIMADATLPRFVGLYHSNGDRYSATAISIWNWGRLYENIVRSYLKGGWKNDTSGKRAAVNYWWGMDSGVIYLVCSSGLPDSTAQLVQVFGDAIRNGTFHPFSGRIRTQTGELLDNRNNPLKPEDIITMDWLADNVTGSLPAFDELLPEAQSLVRIQGVKKYEHFNLI